MNPLVSVVIPTHNASLWIRETLDSILRQTYPSQNMEIIVVDDASTDDTAAIVREHLATAAVRSQVIVLERNSGPWTARNIGWNAAVGDWIQFLDADDLVAPEKIALQVRCITELEGTANLAVVYSSWQHLMFDGGEWSLSGPVEAPDVDDDPSVRILQHGTFGYVGPTLIRRAWVEHVGGFDEVPNIGEDVTLMLSIAMAGGQFFRARSEQPMWWYRQHPDSRWRKAINQVDQMRNLHLAFRRTELFLREERAGGLSDDARHALASRYLKHIDFFLEHDPATFNDIVEWVDGLELKSPLPHVGNGVRLVSTVAGYRRALQLRSAMRQYRGTARRWLQAYRPMPS
jgi:glycosyltransferase involved in cell wall biosynthesis